MEVANRLDSHGVAIDDAGIFVLDAMAASTKRSYRLFVDQYVEFVRKSGQDHSDILVRDWMFSLRDKYTASSLSSGLSHVKKYLHEVVHLNTDAWPLSHELLRTMAHGEVKDRAQAFSATQVRKFLTEFPENNGGILKKLIFAFGVSGGFRCSELAALMRSDVVECEEGIEVKIRKSKTDPAGQGFTKLIIRQTDPKVCPIAIYKRYLTMIPEHRRLFVTYRDSVGFVHVPLSRNTIASIPKFVAEYLMLENIETFKGHSMRATMATIGADNGATVTELIRVGGWKSAAVAEAYVRESRTGLVNAVKRVCGVMEQPLSLGQSAATIVFEHCTIGTVVLGTRESANSAVVGSMQ